MAASGVQYPPILKVIHVDLNGFADSRIFGRHSVDRLRLELIPRDQCDVPLHTEIKPDPGGRHPSHFLVIVFHIFLVCIGRSSAFILLLTATALFAYYIARYVSVIWSFLHVRPCGCLLPLNYVTDHSDAAHIAELL